MDFEGKVGMLYVKDDQKRDKNDFNMAGTVVLFPPTIPWELLESRKVGDYFLSYMITGGTVGFWLVA